MTEMTDEYIRRLRAEVTYTAYSGCFVYIPEFLEFIQRDPDHMMQDCKILKVMESETDELLMEVKYKRSHNTYKIIWMKPGFDIDRYWWMEAFTRLTKHPHDLMGITDKSYRIYIESNHIYDKEADEKKIIFTVEDYNVPEQWLK